MTTQAEKDTAVAKAKTTSGAAIDELATLIVVDGGPPPPGGKFHIGTAGYPTLLEALAALQDGQTLDIEPGDYPTDCGELRADGCTVQCMGGEAVFHTSFDGKSAINVYGDDTTITNIAGENIKNSGANGGVVRMDGNNITVNNMRAHKCEMPYLSGYDHPDSVEVINSPRITNTEVYNVEGGIGHGLYFGYAAEAIVTNPMIDEVLYGHCIKSRAASLVVSGGSLREGHGSMSIDACLGGVLKVDDITIEQGPDTDNVYIIGYGAECVRDAGGNRLPTYTVNTVEIGPGVIVTDTDVPPVGSTTHLFLEPSSFSDESVYNGDLTEPLPPLPVVMPPPPPPPPASALLDKIAAMPPDSWVEFHSLGIVRTINSSSQSGNVIPFANACAYDGYFHEIAVVAADHLVQPRLCIYSLAENRWTYRLWNEQPQFVHAYQHTACIGGIRFYRFGGELLADDGSLGWAKCAPPNISIGQVATVSLSVWPAPYPGATHDALLIYDGNQGQIAAYDAYTNKWLPVLTGMMPGLAGLYHVVSAYSSVHNCLVYGGGNGGNCPVNASGYPNNRVLYRLNADLTTTRMPDAPFHVGVFSGANLIGGSDGNIYVLGFGQHWCLNPSGAGSWTQLVDPPTDLIEPSSGQGFISCTVPGAIVYIDAGYKKAARMRIYKPA